MMRCNVCGILVRRWINKSIISDELAKAWRLSRNQQNKFNLRESMFCPSCNNSTRSRALAEAIMKIFAYPEVLSFKDWIGISRNKSIRIAEINSPGNLHKLLKKLPYLYYSEYLPPLISTNILLSIKSLIYRLIYTQNHQNITNLTYKANFFDLVIHSETLEHVQNIDKAISECRRVLKKGGYCLFTIPLIPSRLTIKRVSIDSRSNKINYFKPASYHGINSSNFDYLVHWEFGGDFINKYNLKVFLSYPQYMLWVLGFRK